MPLAFIYLTAVMGNKRNKKAIMKLSGIKAERQAGRLKGTYLMN